MKRLCVVLGILVGASLLPKTASAGPVTVIDPIIGVRGGMFGSEPVDSGNNISFADCGDAGALDSYSLCAIFNISDSVFNAGVSSITMHFVSSANPDAELVFQNEGGFSQFSFEQIAPGVLEFSGDGALQCPDAVFEGPQTFHTCGTVTGDDIAFGINPILDDYGHPTEDVFALGLTAQVTAVNGTPLSSVPEPATLLLMGMGLATLGHRLRRKNS